MGVGDAADVLAGMEVGSEKSPELEYEMVVPEYDKTTWECQHEVDGAYSLGI